MAHQETPESNVERTKLERSSATALYVLQTDFANPEILSKLPINARHVGRFPLSTRPETQQLKRLRT